MDVLKPENLKDFLPILFERSNAAQSLWNFYAVVLLGLIGFLATAPGTAKTSLVRASMTAGFIIFVAFNLAALTAVTQQRTVLATAINSVLTSGPLEDLRGIRSIAPLWAVWLVHICIDIAMIAVIWKV